MLFVRKKRGSKSEIYRGTIIRTAQHQLGDNLLGGTQSERAEFIWWYTTLKGRRVSRWRTDDDDQYDENNTDNDDPHLQVRYAESTQVWGKHEGTKRVERSMCKENKNKNYKLFVIYATGTI